MWKRWNNTRFMFGVLSPARLRGRYLCSFIFPNQTRETRKQSKVPSPTSHTIILHPLIRMYYSPCKSGFIRSVPSGILWARGVVVIVTASCRIHSQLICIHRSSLGCVTKTPYKLPLENSLYDYEKSSPLLQFQWNRRALDLHIQTIKSCLSDSVVRFHLSFCRKGANERAPETRTEEAKNQ